LDWLKKVDEVLLERAESARSPDVAIDMQQLQERLQALFETKDLSIACNPKGWQPFEPPTDQRRFFELAISPLDSSLFWSIDRSSQTNLLKTLLKVDLAQESLLDSEMCAGAFDYLILEILQQVQQVGFGVPLSFCTKPELATFDLPGQSVFRLLLELQIEGQSAWIELLIPESMRGKWREYVANRAPPALSDAQRESLEVDLALQVGQTTLSFEEVKKLQVGDFILLDSCHYDPVEKKGAVLVTFAQKPLFRGKIKEDGIKLSEYPLYEEAGKMDMDDDAFDDDEFEDDEFDDDDEDLYGEDEEELEEEESPETESAPEEKMAPPVTEEQKEVSIEELEMEMTVEVCRIRMSVKQLQELTPGSTLDLDFPIEKGVNLVVNGKKYATAELMRIGDTLGVRILNLKK